ncbi:MAG: restriction endonuclease subunit S [Aeriscardovia sp.]|nr:restriction endonuclease subunit S [Aeriscardovia sp.]
MSRLSELIAELCPNGVEYKALCAVLVSLPKGTLARGQLLSDGLYPVMNSGRDFYGWYDSKNNSGNAITIAARGEYAGYVNYIERDFWAGGLCYPYRSANKDYALTKYVYHVLKNDEQHIMDSLVVRGSIPALNKKDLEKLRIPVPPIEVQREIVRVLDSFQELDDALTAEIEAREKQLEYSKARLLQSLPKECRAQLSTVANIYDGVHQTPKYTDSGVRFVSVENINDLHGSTKFISEADFNKNYRTSPVAGDVLMTRIGTIGKCAIVDGIEPLAYYVSLSLIRPDSDRLLPSFLRHVLESSIGRIELRKRTIDTAVPIKINLGEIGKLLLPVPSIAEQRVISRQLDDVLVLIEALCNERDARRKQFEHYRDRLLTFLEKVTS